MMHMCIMQIIQKKNKGVKFTTSLSPFQLYYSESDIGLTSLSGGVANRLDIDFQVMK